MPSPGKSSSRASLAVLPAQRRQWPKRGEARSQRRSVCGSNAERIQRGKRTSSPAETATNRSRRWAGQAAAAVGEQARGEVAVEEVAEEEGVEGAEVEEVRASKAVAGCYAATCVSSGCGKRRFNSATSFASSTMPKASSPEPASSTRS